MVRERILDVSELEAPEPFRSAAAAIDDLERGEYLRLCHRRQPYPLYRTLAELGFCYRVREGGSTKYEILIWRADDPTLTAHCGPAADPAGDSRTGSERGCS